VQAIKIIHCVKHENRKLCRSIENPWEIIKIFECIPIETSSIVSDEGEQWASCALDSIGP